MKARTLVRSGGDRFDSTGFILAIPGEIGVIGRFVRRITERRVCPPEDAMVCFHNALFPREITDTGPDGRPLT